VNPMSKLKFSFMKRNLIGDEICTGRPLEKGLGSWITDKGQVSFPVAANCTPPPFPVIITGLIKYLPPFRRGLPSVSTRSALAEGRYEVKTQSRKRENKVENFISWVGKVSKAYLEFG